MLNYLCHLIPCLLVASAASRLNRLYSPEQKQTALDRSLGVIQEAVSLVHEQLKLPCTESNHCAI